MGSKEGGLKMIKLKIPIHPVSINCCWQGRRFKTKDYLKYERDIFYLLREYKRPEMLTNEPIKITFRFYLKSTTKSDADNFLKPIIDILVKQEFLKDDRYIQEYHIYKVKSEEDYIEVEIDKL